MIRQLKNKKILFIVFMFGLVLSFLNNMPYDYEQGKGYKLVLEKYIQSPQTCDNNRITIHPIIAFKPLIPKSILDKTDTIKIKNQENLETITITRDDNFYYYENIFNKDRHYETWREYCQFGECQINLNFYQKEYGYQDTKEYEIQLFEQNGERIWDRNIILEEEVSDIKMNHKGFPKIDLKYKNKLLSVKYNINESIQSNLIVQYNNTGKQDEISRMYKNRTDVSESFTISNKNLEYLAAYVYNEIDEIGFETKLEIINNQNDFKTICE
jgi:hypothetical protein